MATIRLRYVNSFANHGRKTVRRRYYLRRRGEKAISLAPLWASAINSKE